MAKPVNLYQGPAPAAMGMMGQGILEAGANAARSIQSGYESMGRGLAGGIKAVGDAYQQYKDDEAKFDATKKMYKAFGGSLGEEERQGIDDIFADTSMSVREKNALAPTLMQYLGASNMQSQALAKQKAELDARMAQQAASDAEQNKRLGRQLDAQAMAPYQRAEAESLYGSPGGASNVFQPQSFGIAPPPSQPSALQEQFKNQFGRKGR